MGHLTVLQSRQNSVSWKAECEMREPQLQLGWLLEWQVCQAVREAVSYIKGTSESEQEDELDLQSMQDQRQIPPQMGKGSRGLSFGRLDR